MNEAHHEPQGNASYNPDESVTNKHTFQNVQGRFIPPKVGNMPTQPQQQQQSPSEEGSKENTILNGPRHQKEMGAQGHPSGPVDSGRQPWASPVNNQNTDHQDLPECNGTTNGSTRAPAGSGKGPGPSKGKNKSSEPHPGTSSGIGSTTQPAGTSKNTIVCSACGKSGHWSKNCPYYNFCDICGVTTHSTHMCRASKHGNAKAGLPVCIYCGKTNHGSAYCRYRPRDNHEEPQNTPDALRTCTTGKNLAPVARNQTRPTLTIIIRFLSLIQMVEVRINPMEVNTDLNIESKPVLLPEANKWILILVFLLGDSNTLISMKVLTGDILPHVSFPWI